MPLRNRILLAALALGAATLALPSAAKTVVEIQVGPPPPRVEVVPAPRVGYVWAPGYWRWNGRRHVWINGSWVHERRGWRWQPETWVQAPNGRWHLRRGYWAR
ncbi:MAG TPA: hypothetical protein VGK37_08985 [Casimicrobiaceae bacterium]|jgi:hypothetical protein